MTDTTTNDTPNPEGSPREPLSDLPSASRFSMPYDEIVAAYSGFIGEHKKAVAAKMREACDEITRRAELYPQGYPSDLANCLGNMQHLANQIDPPVIVGPAVLPVVPGPGSGVNASNV